jgi:hypothetical protein
VFTVGTSIASVLTAWAGMLIFQFMLPIFFQSDRQLVNLKAFLRNY